MGLGQGCRAAHKAGEAGYAMAALLVGLSVMAVLMSMAMPVWTTFNKREREAELIFRGQQYARAIGLFQRKYANTFPPNVDVLVEQRFLRKKYKDPITNEDFQMIPAGGGGNPGGQQRPGGQQGPGGNQQPSPFAAPGASMTVGQGQGNRGSAQGGLNPTGGGIQPSIGIQGVVSKSGDKSVKIYNGRTKYNEWAFIHVATAQQPGMPNMGGPGQQGPNRNPGQNPNQPNPFVAPGMNRPNIPNGPGFGQQQPPTGSRPVFTPGNPPKG